MVGTSRGEDDLGWPPHGGAYADPPAAPRPSTTGTGNHTYEASGAEVVSVVVLTVYLIVSGIVLVAVGEDEGSLAASLLGMLLLADGGLSAFLGLRMPRRITLDDSGVLIEATMRRVDIPWDELERVAPPRWGHRGLTWWRRGGRPVRTSRNFPNIHRMLAEVERRVPHVPVSS